MPSKKLVPVIICGAEGRAVVFGWAEKMPEVGVPCSAKKARMVLYWPPECGGLFGLATNGPKDGLRLTSAVDEVKDTPQQVLTVTQDAANALDGWPDA
jgi:hypothetical protein